MKNRFKYFDVVNGTPQFFYSDECLNLVNAVLRCANGTPISGDAALIRRAVIEEFDNIESVQVIDGPNAGRDSNGIMYREPIRVEQAVLPSHYEVYD